MRTFNKNLATVVAMDGYHQIILPSGDSVPCLTSTRVTDTVNEPQTCFAKLLVNIAESKEDALAKYGITIALDEYKKLAISEMAEAVILSEDDVEDAHLKADDALCEFLVKIGHKDLVDKFKEVRKWYS